MSVLNFPTSPSTGDLYTFGDYTYRYDGEKWTTISLGNVATLRADLANPDKGAALVGHKGRALSQKLSAEVLSVDDFAGSGADRLLSALVAARDSGAKLVLGSSITVTTLVSVDFGGQVLCFDFCGHSIISDIACLSLTNLGDGSEIISPSLVNITTPWAITRWDANGDWLSNGAPVLATLTQTNADGYYQPSANDSDIWASLTPSQQSQNVSPRLIINDSNNVLLVNPKGRYCLYEFNGCNHCEVVEPNIQSGGKGALGTIVFNNTSNSGYGIGNFVRGGTVRYGSFSGVAFLRNKAGGVTGGFMPFRVGESGVKTFQNEVSGRSARCYNMKFDGIFPYQVVFDGLDTSADYGPPVERVDDYTLAEYPWNELPTAHTISNVHSSGCQQAGLWGDGQNVVYSSVSAKDCQVSGIKFIGVNSTITGAVVSNCNARNVASGEHQITVPKAGNVIQSPTVYTSAAITAGRAIFAPESTVTHANVSGSMLSQLAVSYGGGQLSTLRIGADVVTEDSVAIDLHPRATLLPNGAGEVGAVLLIGSGGSETGTAHIKGRQAGTLVHGVKAIGDKGGVGVLAVASDPAVTNLSPSEVFFYESGGNLWVNWINSGGVAVTKQITP